MSISKFLIVLFIIAFCCQLGCTEDSTKGYSVNKTNCNTSWSLKKSAEKVFLLDSVSGNRPSMIQLFTDPKSRDLYFTCFNSKNYSIDFFDYNSGKLQFRTKLQVDGPNAVPGMMGYTIKNLDSIFLSGDAGGYIFNIVDTSSHRVRSELLELEGQPNFIRYFPYPTIDEGRPFSFAENKLVCVGNNRLEYSNDTRENRKVLAFYDMTSFVPTFKVSYPDFYQYGNWWGNLFRTSCYTYNPDKKIFVVSFPASHSIVVYDPSSDEQYEKYAGGCKMGTIYPGTVEFTQADKIEPLIHFMKNDHYLKIIYDPFRKCYYRFGVKGSPNVNLSDRSTFLTTLFIIILDENFEKVGELELDSKQYGVGGLSFVTNEGLFLNYFADKTEDKLVFHAFNLEVGKL